MTPVPRKAGDLLLSVIECLSIGSIDLRHRFVNVAVVRAHKFILGCRLELTISLDGILPLGMFYRGSMKHSLFLDLYICDHRRVLSLLASIASIRRGGVIGIIGSV